MTEIYTDSAYFCVVVFWYVGSTKRTYLQNVAQKYWFDMVLSNVYALFCISKYKFPNNYHKL